MHLPAAPTGIRTLLSKMARGDTGHLVCTFSQFSVPCAVRVKNARGSRVTGSAFRSKRFAQFTVVVSPVVARNGANTLLLDCATNVCARGCHGGFTEKSPRHPRVKFLTVRTNDIDGCIHVGYTGAALTAPSPGRYAAHVFPVFRRPLIRRIFCGSTTHIRPLRMRRRRMHTSTLYHGPFT